MDWLEKVKNRLLDGPINDEQYYAQALAEIETGKRRPGLWAKAFARSDGNVEKAKSIYIQLLAHKLLVEARDLKTKARLEARKAAKDRDQNFEAIKRREVERTYNKSPHDWDRAQKEHMQEHSWLVTGVWAVMLLIPILIIYLSKYLEW